MPLAGVNSPYEAVAQLASVMSPVHTGISTKILMINEMVIICAMTIRFLAVTTPERNGLAHRLNVNYSAFL